MRDALGGAYNSHNMNSDKISRAGCVKNLMMEKESIADITEQEDIDLNCENIVQLVSNDDNVCENSSIKIEDNNTNMDTQNIFTFCPSKRMDDDESDLEILHSTDLDDFNNNVMTSNQIDSCRENKIDDTTSHSMSYDCIVFVKQCFLFFFVWIFFFFFLGSLSFIYILKEEEKGIIYILKEEEKEILLLKDHRQQNRPQYHLIITQIRIMWRIMVIIQKS